MRLTHNGVEYERIEGFGKYAISEMGEVLNLETGYHLARSQATGGDVRVNLADGKGDNHTRSVKGLVAKAFLPESPEPSFDTVILLDGDRWNLTPRNMARRPRWYAMKYAQQWYQGGFSHHMGPRVRNMTRGRQYPNVYEAGMADGVLWDHIKESADFGEPVQVLNYMYEWSNNVFGGK